MTHTLIKYVTYRLRQDETAESEFEARCVFGDEVKCGAESGVRSAPAEVDEWMRRHTGETRHNRYRRSRADYQLWEPAEPVPPPLDPGQAEEVPAC